MPKSGAKRSEGAKKIEQVKIYETNTQFTVKELIDLYLTNVIEDRYVLDSKTGNKKLIPGARKRKGQDEARRTLYGDAVRVLVHIRADQVTRKDVVNMISEIIERGANVQAGRVLAELTLAYDYCIGLEKFKDDFANPALLAKSSLKQSRVKLTHKKGSRVLSDKEIKKVLEWLPTSGFSEKLRHIIRITLWTGCRTGEVCELQWADIDFEKSTWHLKGSKNGTDRYVQLSKQCLEYIKAISHESDFLFESRIKGRTITQKILTVYKWQMRHPEKLSYALQPEQLWLSDIEDWSPHDLRRTVRTGLSRLSCPAEIAEAVLGHSKKGIQASTFILVSIK
ncbi:tyrosine-type recombinase/integrase [Acinetobacter variabilis]|uniref:tyrosine-type recombinase/integrase n=1 Tax=Acinetobacter variabilis TaxID=70346 RepID=UPI002897DCEC|nr:tyrosine-type recombinase/integrase [Acinetobacter variabilis]